jgi:hypothetical protein
MHLRLSGFVIDSLEVKIAAPVLKDELKTEQSQVIFAPPFREGGYPQNLKVGQEYTVTSCSSELLFLKEVCGSFPAKYFVKNRDYACETCGHCCGDCFCDFSYG